MRMICSADTILLRVTIHRNSSDMDNGSIKDNIIRKRNELGISQEEMARRLGIVRNTYRNIERGQSAIINSHLLSIAKNLETTPEELVLGYTPIDGTDTLNEIRVKYETEHDRMVKSYERQLKDVSEKVAMLESTIRDLRETIESKNEIISLMKRRETERQTGNPRSVPD